MQRLFLIRWILFAKKRGGFIQTLLKNRGKTLPFFFHIMEGKTVKGSKFHGRPFKVQSDIRKHCGQMGLKIIKSNPHHVIRRYIQVQIFRAQRIMDEMLQQIFSRINKFKVY